MSNTNENLNNFFDNLKSDEDNVHPDTLAPKIKFLEFMYKNKFTLMASGMVFCFAGKFYLCDSSGEVRQLPENEHGPCTEDDDCTGFLACSFDKQCAKGLIARGKKCGEDGDCDKNLVCFGSIKSQLTCTLGLMGSYCVTDEDCDGQRTCDNLNSWCDKQYLGLKDDLCQDKTYAYANDEKDNKAYALVNKKYPDHQRDSDPYHQSWDSSCTSDRE